MLSWMNEKPHWYVWWAPCVSDSFVCEGGILVTYFQCLTPSMLFDVVFLIHLICADPRHELWIVRPPIPARFRFGQTKAREVGVRYIKGRYVEGRRREGDVTEF